MPWRKRAMSTDRDHLKFFKKVPMQIWDVYYFKFNKQYVDSFAIDYNKKGVEQYYIEEHLFKGIAYGGPFPIKKVEISFDAGRTWNDAPFEWMRAE